MPARQEPGEGGLLDRLHLAAQSGQRAPPEEAQDLRIAPLPLGATGPELPAQDGIGREKTFESILDRGHRHAPPGGRCRAEKWSVSPRPASEEPVEGLDRRTQEGRRHAEWRLDPEPIAISGYVLDRDPALLAGDPHLDRPPRRGQLGKPTFGGSHRATGITVRAIVGAELNSCRRFIGRKVAQPSQEVMEGIGGLGLSVIGQGLQGQLEVGQGLGIDQLAQLLLAQQLPEQVAVQGQRLGSPLGQRRVALVHVNRDVIEQ